MCIVTYYKYQLLSGYHSYYYFSPFLSCYKYYVFIVTYYKYQLLSGYLFRNVLPVLKTAFPDWPRRRASRDVG